MSIKYKVDDNIGFIAFDDPEAKVNVLNFQTIRRFDEILDKVQNNASLKALIISSHKKDVFVAGADIKEIEKITLPLDGAEKAKAGQDVFNKLEDLNIPTVAVIDGVALGGGCELILACDYRISTFNDKVKIGLPEVNLGFVPGFGGTVRLPKLVGLSEGLKMILAGKPINSAKALKIGLVDKLVPQNGLMTQVLKFVEQIQNTHKKDPKNKRNKRKGIVAFLEGNPVGRSIIFSESRKSVLKLSKGFYPAPLRAIDVIQKNYGRDRKASLDYEAKSFGELAITNISKNLVHIFYMAEKYKKLSLKGAEDVKPGKIEKGAVLGAGIMGGGIAQLFSSRGIWARVKDINYEALGNGLKAAASIYKKAVKTRRMSKAQAASQMAHITTTLDYTGFSSVDIVIEAVVEKMELKKQVFQELSEATNDHCILATNTSALSVSEMAKSTKDPSRVIGFHFFNPVHRMPLIEVITTPETSQETIVTSLNLVKKLGKTPILVKDSCGFVVNRILLGYINEAGRVLEECGQMEAIDKAMTDFGMPMGPFLLSDEVGLDVGIKVLRILEDGLGERYKPVSTFEKVFEKGLLGKKTGVGYYRHAKKRMPAPEAMSLVTSKGQPFNKEETVDRLVLAMVNEAAMCLEESIVDEPHAIDIGMIFGTGFPPFRGGLLKYADDQGLDKVVDKMEALSEKYQAPHFKPAKYILQLKSKGKGFYSG